MKRSTRVPASWRRLSRAACITVIMAGCQGQGGRDADAETAEGRITLQPTADDELPAAILGSAPMPLGVDVKYFDEDSAATGYLAVPTGEGPFPAVILIHEWNGLVDRIRQTADALAAEGYVALAADLYSGRTGSNSEENMALVREVRSDEARMITNLNAAARFLRDRSDVTGKIATMGWCFGGGVALSFAIGGDNHDGTAIFYGSLVEDPAVLASITHPVYGTFAALDQGIPPDQVDRFAAALREAGVENDIHVYDDVNHGFWLYVDRNPEMTEAPALDAWQRLKAYLRSALSD